MVGMGFYRGPTQTVMTVLVYDFVIHWVSKPVFLQKIEVHKGFRFGRTFVPGRFAFRTEIIKPFDGGFNAMRFHDLRSQSVRDNSVAREIKKAVQFYKRVE